MSELVEFLLARIAEDEMTARTATPGPWTADGGSVWAGHPSQDVVDYTGDSAQHIAAWNPARVLAECAAKRRIVEFYAGPRGWLYVLNFLTLPYADHPDYRSEWAP